MDEEEEEKRTYWTLVRKWILIFINENISLVSIILKLFDITEIKY